MYKAHSNSIEVIKWIVHNNGMQISVSCKRALMLFILLKEPKRSVKGKGRIPLAGASIPPKTLEQDPPTDSPPPPFPSQ